MLRRFTSLIICIFLFTAVLNAALFKLADEGSENIVDYSKYGRFEDVGTPHYRYVITDSAGLSKAVGEGIFPNSQSLSKDPGYLKFRKKGKLKGSQWNYVNSEDYQANFYKWAEVQDNPGTKLYYAAVALEKAGLIKQAIKAYYGVIVHFPKSHGMTYWDSPWYMGTVAIDKIKYLCRENPELGMRLEGASIDIKNSFNLDAKNCVFTINPGKIVSVKPGESTEPAADISKLQVIKTIGDKRIKLLQFSNNHWQLTVDGKPYYIRGIAYMPNQVGLSPDNGTLNVHKDWMYSDLNKNGKIDGPYDSWVDRNRNNKQDKDDPPVGDFKLMKDMGVNTLRLYDHIGFNKQLLKEGYENFGFMYLIGDPIGMYAIGSGADWYKGTDYTDPTQIKNMLERVRQMVEEYKDEPYILMWVLGNENNYAEPGIPGEFSGSGCRAKLQPEAYYKFVNEAAKLVKSLDPQHRPVAVGNGDTLFLDICAKNAPDIDIFGANSYRGQEGFGSLWRDVSVVYNKPVLITEYGCSAYHPDWSIEKCEQGQLKYLRGNWIDIESNFAGYGDGNALGGILFEWVDEWWKANSDLPLKIRNQNKEWYKKRSKLYKNLKPGKHDIVPQFGAPFLDGWSYEEWLGITTQGNGKHSPFERQLRPAYFEYIKMWEKYK